MIRDYGIVVGLRRAFRRSQSCEPGVLQPGQPAEHPRPVVGDVDHRGGGHARPHRRRLRPLGRLDLRLLRRDRRASTVGHIGAWGAILLGVAAGLGCGVVNGIIATWGRINPFIATLATEHHDRRVRARAYGWEPDQRARQRALHRPRTERLRDDQVLRLDAPRLHAALRLPAFANDLRPPRLRLRAAIPRPPGSRACA